MQLFRTTLAAAALAVGLTAPSLAFDDRYDLIVVVADEDSDVLHFVRNLDTGAAAAFWSEDGEPVYDGDASRLLKDAMERSGFDQPARHDDDAETTRIRFMGFEVSASESEDGDSSAVVGFNLDGDGGQMRVDTRDDEDGERALVTMSDADEDDASEFVDDIDDASSADKRALRTHLGLEEK